MIRGWVCLFLWAIGCLQEGRKHGGGCTYLFGLEVVSKKETRKGVPIPGFSIFPVTRRKVYFFMRCLYSSSQCQDLRRYLKMSTPFTGTCPQLEIVNVRRWASENRGPFVNVRKFLHVSHIQKLRETGSIRRDYYRLQMNLRSNGISI